MHAQYFVVVWITATAQNQSEVGEKCSFELKWLELNDVLRLLFALFLLHKFKDQR